MQLNWHQGGAPYANALKVAALDYEHDLTETDRNFIRYIGLIPQRANVELTRRRTVDHDVVQLIWDSQAKSGKACGRAAFFDISPWIIGRLTNAVDADEREAV